MFLDIEYLSGGRVGWSQETGRVKTLFLFPLWVAYAPQNAHPKPGSHQGLDTSAKMECSVGPAKSRQPG